MSLERIVITFTADGKFRGASVTNYGDGPEPLTAAELATLLPAINAAALARVSELEAAAEDHLVALSALASVRAELAKGEKAEADAIAAIVDAGLLSADEKEAAALEASIASATVKLTSLRAAK